MIEIRRLAPGDEELVAALTEDEPPDADALLRDASNAAAMALYESVGGVRRADDDVVWDFDYTAG